MSDIKDIGSLGIGTRVASLLGLHPSGAITKIPFAIQYNASNQGLSTDLNDYTSTGLFVCHTAFTNAPQKEDGSSVNTSGAFLFVSDRGTEYQGQLLWCAVFDMGIYYRSRRPGWGWSAWQKVTAMSV